LNREPEVDAREIPPDGVSAEFSVDIPIPSGLEYINGIQIRFAFETDIPAQFFPVATLDGEDIPLDEYARDVLSLTRVGQLPESFSGTVSLSVAINREGHLAPGNSVTIYAWGVQILKNADLPGPATVSNPTTLDDAVEVGIVEVMTWPEWYRLTGRDGS
jgi:hypothetical protein